MRDLEVRLRDLTKQEEAYVSLQNKQKAYEARLARERELSPFRKAAALFFLPFGRAAFETMHEWIIFLLGTILFASCASFVGVLMLLAAVADVAYLALYAVFYPLLVLFYALAYPFRVLHFRRRAASLGARVAQFDIADLRAKIAAVNKKMAEERKKEEAERSSSSSGHVHVSDRVKETDWYKNKVDEEYRRLMGYPPKDTSLPTYATDVTLDLHPGDH